MSRLVRKLLFSGLALLCLIGLVPGVQAGLIYGITFPTGGNEQLITIDTVTGAGALVGNLSTPMSAFGLGFRGNQLYTFDQQADLIRELNPATGATVNSINVGIVAVGEGGLAFRRDGLGFLSSSQGNVGQFFSFTLAPPANVLINPTLTPSMDGLAFDANDVLYGLRQGVGQPGGSALYTLNQATGATNLVGLLGLNDNSSLGGLTFDEFGDLFAAVSVAGGSNLYRVDQATGAATLVGNIGFANVSGLASPGEGMIVPEPTSMTLLGVGALGLLGYGWRRRKQSA